MHPADLERELARLVRLAEAARAKLEEIGENVQSLRESISNAGTSAGANAGAEAGQTADPTTESEAAQAEVASK